MADVLERLSTKLTEEQLLIRDAARTFAKNRLAPGAAERDRTQAYPHDLFGELAEMGLLAMKVSEEDEGSGTDNVGYVLAMEAIAEACASTAVILASSNLSTKILADHGSDAQRDRWLRPYARGKLGPASFALTEPGAGSDAGGIRTTATKEGDHYVLNGQKMWITSGAHAGIHLVFAKTNPDAGSRGISAFIVDEGTPGLSVGSEEDKMGLRSSGTVALHFDGCKIHEDQRVGEEGEGYPIALSALAAGRIGIAAQSIGIAESALGEALSYVQERRAFGQRLSDFQNTQFVLANCRMELDAAWLLMLRAARRLDEGHRARMESSMAKLFASETCGRIVDHAVQLHGGYGYSREYAVERYYRDARVTRIYEGTSEVQRMVIARELLEG
jgi:alkylation response protein AidB-like acyl-CoA dehydrogenase